MKGKEQRKRAETVLRKDSRVFSATNEAAHAIFPTTPLQTQVRLSSVGCVKLVDRRGYLTVVLPRFVSQKSPNPLQIAENNFFHLKSQGGTGQFAPASSRGRERVAHSNPGIFRTVPGVGCQF